ncbi:adenosine deaminase [Gordonia sp. NPDC003422]
MRRITDLPKVELHVHIEGTLEPELVMELAESSGVDLPYANADELRRRYVFTNLQSFLDIYYDNLDVLRTNHDFSRLAYEYAVRAHAGGVVHAEVFFDPQAHLIRGVALDTVVDGLVDGFARARSDCGFTADLIACFLRDRPVREALETLESLTAIDAPIIGVGLDSAELGNPASLFTEVFARAAALGLRRVAHAGEEGGPESIRQALDDLGAERIDHGIRSLDDPEMVARLVAAHIPLTVCPLSNVALQSVDELARHPLPELLAAGLHVTINSDDPAYFGGYAEDNYVLVAAAFDLDDATLADLARNSVRASFLPVDRQDEVLLDIDRWLADAHPT